MKTCQMKTTHLNLALVVGCILAVSFTLSHAANQQQNADPTAKTGSCSYSGSGVVDNCILHDKNGNSFIAPRVLRDLDFDRHGLAQVHSEENLLWMYVNRRGRVVINGVPNFDNGADYFSDGLVRTIVNGKYGFANRKGKIVIKPNYDWASPFEHGYAAACNHCREVCAMPGGTVELKTLPGGCDHRIMTGGEWFKIDKKGRTTARPPSE